MSEARGTVAAMVADEVSQLDAGATVYETNYSIYLGFGSAKFEIVRARSERDSIAFWSIFSIAVVRGLFSSCIRGS